MSPAVEPVVDLPWQPGPAAPRLEPGGIHVWRVGIEIPGEEMTRRRLLLDGEELGRADRFRFDRHRRAFVASHGALRLILGRYLGAAPAGLRFLVNEHGKPRLPDPEAPRFNLSHSGSLALVALAAGREIGVDVEALRSPGPEDDVAPRLFAAAEYELWRGLPPVERRRAFFRGWAVKEAAVKAIGRGIGYPLHDLEALRRGPDGGTLRFAAALDGDRRHWAVVELAPGPEHAGAVVAEGGAFVPRLFDF